MVSIWNETKLRRVLQGYLCVFNQNKLIRANENLIKRGLMRSS